MYIFNKANSYITYSSFKSKIQNVVFQFGSINYSYNVLLMPEQGCHARPCKGHTPTPTPTQTRMHTRAHTHTHAHFGKIPLPSAAPGITSVQSEAVLRTQHLQGDHTKSINSLTIQGDAITKCFHREKQTEK